MKLTVCARMPKTTPMLAWGPYPLSVTSSIVCLPMMRYVHLCICDPDLRYEMTFVVKCKQEPMPAVSSVQSVHLLELLGVIGRWHVFVCKEVGQTETRFKQFVHTHYKSKIQVIICMRSTEYELNVSLKCLNLGTRMLYGPMFILESSLVTETTDFV